MKQAPATGQKPSFGGENCNLGAKKQREEKEKTALLVQNRQERRLSDVKIKEIIPAVSLLRSKVHPSLQESFHAEIFPALWHAAQRMRNGCKISYL